jgi:transcriptional regulator with XRE-family HTH domain
VIVAERAAGEPRTLAEKLDYLFKTVHPRGRGEYTYREAAAVIEEQGGGPTISASYIHQLRTGAKDNPTKRHLEGLARFFGVSPAYFFDDVEAEKIDAQLAVLAAMRDADVRNVALRAAGLSPESLDIIRGMIERTRQLEGLTGRGTEESQHRDGDAHFP